MGSDRDRYLLLGRLVGESLELLAVAPAIVSVCFGGYLFVRSAGAARAAGELDYNTFGIRLEASFYEAVVLLGGLAFFAVGLLGLAGVIEFSPLT